jgi:hypothetical protein
MLKAFVSTILLTKTTSIWNCNPPDFTLLCPMVNHPSANTLQSYPSTKHCHCTSTVLPFNFCGWIIFCLATGFLTLPF